MTKVLHLVVVGWLLLKCYLPCSTVKDFIDQLVIITLSVCDTQSNTTLYDGSSGEVFTKKVLRLHLD